ncbi:uncharacterized protein IUM83_17759 [Phytophthora cinnamomi]|nr:hypothetical protein IUM83_17759 [Phytophthora cinnamomi]
MFSHAQYDGIITFYGDKNFKGDKYQFHRTLEPQYCYNDNVGKPSSITWKNQIQTGSFDGKAKIAVFTDHDCHGAVVTWFTTEKDFPRDLTADGIDNSIKSFMLVQTSLEPDVIVRDVV